MMTAEEVHELRLRADVGEKLALVAMEMVLTLGQRQGRRFDLAGYAAKIDVDPEAGTLEDQSRRRVADTLRRMAAAMEG